MRRDVEQWRRLQGLEISGDGRVEAGVCVSSRVGRLGRLWGGGLRGFWGEEIDRGDAVANFGEAAARF